jgi:hypothetical protein
MLARHEEEAGPRQHNAACDDLQSLRIERRGRADAAPSLMIGAFIAALRLLMAAAYATNNNLKQATPEADPKRRRVAGAFWSQ